MNRRQACGLILAGGASARFDAGPKQLADLGGRPLLQHAVSAMNAVTSLDRVVVVLGASAPQILEAVDFGRAEPVICADWESGQSASLRTGARALSGASKVVVTLGDQPFITSEVIALMAQQRPGARATYHGQPGHPVVLGPEHLKAIEHLRGDTGARSLIANHLQLECSDLGSARDIDTCEDLT